MFSTQTAALTAATSVVCLELTAWSLSLFLTRRAADHRITTASFHHFAEALLLEAECENHAKIANYFFIFFPLSDLN